MSQKQNKKIVFWIIHLSCIFFINIDTYSITHFFASINITFAKCNQQCISPADRQLAPKKKLFDSTLNCGDCMQIQKCLKWRIINYWSMIRNALWRRVSSTWIGIKIIYLIVILLRFKSFRNVSWFYFNFQIFLYSTLEFLLSVSHPRPVWLIQEDDYKIENQSDKIIGESTTSLLSHRS